MISENRIISHLMRKPWVTQPGELRATAWESTLPTVLRQVLGLFLGTDHCQRKISRPRLGWELAQQMKQKASLCNKPLLLSALTSSTRDLQTPSESIKKHNPLWRAPFSAPAMCLTYSLLCTQRVLHSVYISEQSWYSNIVASKNATTDMKCLKWDHE